MRKRATLTRKTLTNNSNRRRLMLKRVHKKVLLRRRQFLQFDLQQSYAEAS